MKNVVFATALAIGSFGGRFTATEITPIFHDGINGK